MTERISGLEKIENPPELFFTVNDGKNNQSVQIIERLQELRSRDGAFSATARCLVFPSWEAVPSDIPWNSVMVFDGEYRGKTFSPIYRISGPNHRRFPQCAAVSTLWAVAVKPRLLGGRIETVALQIKADFHKHFMFRIHQGQLPWGDAKSDGGKKRKERKDARERHGLYRCAHF